MQHRHVRAGGLDWRGYDPSWLVALAESQAPELTWLTDALPACRKAAWQCDAYLYFVDPGRSATLPVVRPLVAAAHHAMAWGRSRQQAASQGSPHYRGLAVAGETARKDLGANEYPRRAPLAAAGRE